MRTISATVGTREEAESAQRRLEALGIEPDRILFKEVGGTGDEAREPSIFVTVKVAPEQVGAATDILNRGGAGAREPAGQAAVAAPQPSPAAPMDGASSPARVRVTDRDSSPPRSEPAERVERRTATPEAGPHAAPARDRQGSRPTLARIASIAALLAGLGFAAGAALGVIL